MDLSYSAEYEEFRTEVRKFLDQNWTDEDRSTSPSAEGQAALMGALVRTDDRATAFRLKAIERGYLYRHVPRELVERPKMGFGIPLGSWLRGPLRDWAETLLAERRLREAGLLDARRVRRRWAEHLSGSHNWQYLLWDVLMLEAWRDRWART